MSEGIHHLPRLGIASAMRLYGFTARALRFYEERGLIEARRDRLNSRFYDATARGRLEWISRLRRIGLALSDVEAVLEAGSPQDQAAEALARVKKRCEVLDAELTTARLLFDELTGTRPDARAVSA